MDNLEPDEYDFVDEIAKYGINWMHGETDPILHDVATHIWQSEWFNIQEHRADLDYCGCDRMFRDAVHYQLNCEENSKKYSFFALELAFRKAAKILIVRLIKKKENK